MTTWHIKKIDEDRYKVWGGDQFTPVEELVNGSQLVGMLNGKVLLFPQITDILVTLDAREVGFQTTITFQPHAA